MSNYTIRQSPLFGGKTTNQFNAFEDAKPKDREIISNKGIEKIVIFQGNTITGFEVKYRGKKDPIVHGFKPANQDVLTFHSVELKDDDEIYAVSGVIGVHKDSKELSWIFRMIFVIRNKKTGEFTLKDFGSTDKMIDSEVSKKPFQSNGPIIGFAGYTKGMTNRKGIKFTGLPPGAKNPPEFRQRVFGIAFIKRINGAHLQLPPESLLKIPAESLLKKIITPSSRSALKTHDESGDESNSDDKTIAPDLSWVDPKTEGVPKPANSTIKGCHMIYFKRDLDQEHIMTWAKIVDRKAHLYPPELGLGQYLVASDVRHLSKST